jgi:Cyclic phosphodiesterase-like protein.
VSDEYSIWLLPDRDTDAYQHLSNVISEYAQVYADAPKFEPHITVLGGIDTDIATIQNGIEDLAEEYNPIQVIFTKAQCSTTKHQCVFLLVEPTTDILSAHRTMRDICKIDQGMYVPHLSLIYSEMSVTERLKITNSIDIPSFQNNIYADEIVLIDTEGDVPDWNIIQSCDLCTGR